ncbi:RICIN domain-containing protein [Streptomyces sp. NPDC007084]|uniref:RICIN domain-containing protein n=1 Tax=Streptomyces sp. NPDC007084 TaxID=3154313 RepID=UPI0034542618
MLLTGAGLSAALLATVLAVSLWSHDDQGADPATATGASSGHTLGPVPGAPVPPVTSGPSATAGVPGTAAHTRLRNLAADLCLDIRGAKLRAGVGTRLAVCSSAWTQQWSYEQDGLLRSVADPGLCLDSRADNGVVFLARCVGDDAKRSEDMRYDLTVRGELLPRRHEGLALAPESTEPDADVLVRVRDGSDAQRWQTDGSSPRPGSRSVAGTSPLPGATSRAPSAGGTTGAADGPSESPRAGASVGTGVPVPQTYRGERRAVTVHDGLRSGPAPAPRREARGAVTPEPAAPAPAGPGPAAREPVAPEPVAVTDVEAGPLGGVGGLGGVGAVGGAGS